MYLAMQTILLMEKCEIVCSRSLLKILICSRGEKETDALKHLIKSLNVNMKRASRIKLIRQSKRRAQWIAGCLLVSAKVIAASFSQLVSKNDSQIAKTPCLIISVALFPLTANLDRNSKTSLAQK